MGCLKAICLQCMRYAYVMLVFTWAAPYSRPLRDCLLPDEVAAYEWHFFIKS